MPDESSAFLGGGAMRVSGRVVVDSGCGDQWPRLRGLLHVHAPECHDIASTLSAGDTPYTGAQLFIVGSRAANGELSHGLVRRIRGISPHAAIYVLGEDWELLLTRGREYALAGADEILAGGSHTWQSLADLVSRRLALPPLEAALHELVTVVQASAGRTIAFYALRNSWHCPGQENVAAFFHWSVGTVNGRLIDAGLPSVGFVIAVGVLLHADELIRDGVKPRQRVAELLRIPSARALAKRRRNVLRHPEEEPGVVLLKGIVLRSGERAEWRRPRDHAVAEKAPV